MHTDCQRYWHMTLKRWCSHTSHMFVLVTQLMNVRQQDRAVQQMAIKYSAHHRQVIHSSSYYVLSRRCQTQAGACNIRHDKAEHISHEVCLRDFKLQSVLLQLCKDCVQSERNTQGSSRMWPIVVPAPDSRGSSLQALPVPRLRLDE